MGNRTFFAGTLAALAAFASTWAAPMAHAEGSDKTITVTLLGTGTPDPRIDRFGPSTLVEAGGKRLLFDVGRGATIRLQQIGVPLGQLTAVFMTHYHSDHTNGIPDLWLTGWLPPHGARKTPLRMIGPVGLKNMMHYLALAYAADIDIREKDEKLPASGVAVDATEFEKEGVVFDEDGVRVTAVTVDHGEWIKPAFGYKIEYGGRSVVLSGDTRYSEHLANFAKDTDLFLHEVAAAPDSIKDFPAIQRILGHHTRPEECGRVFTIAKPHLAAYTHFVLLPDASGHRPSVQLIIDETRQTYAGPLEVGEDLMRFVLGPKVEVKHFDPARQAY